MTAQRLDITIEQGADYDGYFQLEFDPAGYGFAMQIKLAAGFPYAILTLKSSTGGLLIDDEERRVYPVIPASVAAAIIVGKYAYDLKAISPEGKVSRAYQGVVYVSGEVTDIDDIPPGAETDLLAQDGSGFFWQDGSGVSMPDGDETLLAFQDDSIFSYQDDSEILLPTGAAGVFASFQDGSLYGFQASLTLQIV